MEENQKKSIAFKKSQTTNMLAYFIFGLFTTIMVVAGVKVFNSSSLSEGNGKEWYSITIQIEVETKSKSNL